MLTNYWARKTRNTDVFFEVRYEKYKVPAGSPDMYGWKVFSNVRTSQSHVQALFDGLSISEVKIKILGAEEAHSTMLGKLARDRPKFTVGIVWESMYGTDKQVLARQLKAEGHGKKEFEALVCKELGSLVGAGRVAEMSGYNKGIPCMYVDCH